ncbi:MAG TPA: hypothetical protein IAC04_01685, partial [Candidatus Coprenecus stercoravium]|nr:hypothetical protein [Candidatus Coprenecus stercoravium]
MPTILAHKPIIFQINVSYPNIKTKCAYRNAYYNSYAKLYISKAITEGIATPKAANIQSSRPTVLVSLGMSVFTLSDNMKYIPHIIFQINEVIAFVLPYPNNIDSRVVIRQSKRYTYPQNTAFVFLRIKAYTVY